VTQSVEEPRKRKRKRRGWLRELDEATREDDRVFIWRRHTFEEAGFSEKEATALACTRHHVEEAKRLLAMGCPNSTIVDILT
jgi:hypothetical protein